MESVRSKSNQCVMLSMRGCVRDKTRCEVAVGVVVRGEADVTRLFETRLPAKRFRAVAKSRFQGITKRCILVRGLATKSSSNLHYRRQDGSC